MTDNFFPPALTPLFDIFTGPVKMAVMQAALELSIADILTEAMDAEAMARALNIDADPAGLAYFLDSMAAVGFVTKICGQYRNTDFADTYFRSESPLYMGPFIARMTAMQHKNLSRIVQLVTTGPPALAEKETLETETRWEKAAADLAVYQQTGAAQVAADLARSLPEFEKARKLLDLGGGPGLIGATIVKQHPTMAGVLLDLPAIIRQAEKHIRKFGMADRISFISGDYNEADLGRGYDLVWVSHNLYYAKEKPVFFNRLKAAMTDGGVLLCVHEGLTHERTQPAPIVLSRLSLALEGQDVSFNKGELADHFRRAGFATVESRPLNFGIGQSELVIARKGKGGAQQ
ncbi:methyltransferase [uncultured Desulfobacter sp.]|uniref:methyltransferase n=1 Tax=uncultured Desulfobacter sp. TaxID=240139 RepID=UPI002AAAA333|nr:methyltransferase [uncultured Desulfobacter sp.]